MENRKGEDEIGGNTFWVAASQLGGNKGKKLQYHPSNPPFPLHSPPADFVPLPKTYFFAAFFPLCTCTHCMGALTNM